MFSNLKKKEYMEPEVSDIFFSKSGHQKYTAWDATTSCFCNVMSLFEETYKFSKSDCYT